MWHSVLHFFKKKKNNRKQDAFRSPTGKEKQLDYVVIDRRNRKYCTDAEATDMIHLGCDHRSVTKGGLESKRTTT